MMSSIWGLLNVKDTRSSHKSRYANLRTRVLQVSKKYLMLPMLVFSVSGTALVMSHYSAQIGLYFGASKTSIIFLYTILFFLSHFIFFVPLSSSKEIYRMTAYVLVMSAAVYNTTERFQDVMDHPYRYIKHDVFVQPFLLANSV